jgi:phospholipase/lecithinase/hemolysin
MKSNSLRFHFAVVAAVLLTGLSVARAAIFTGIFAFGDSLTDTGNTSLATGGALPGASYFNGRYSNGPVWLENFAGYVGLPAPTPSIAGGRDFAFAGAFTQTGGQVPTIAQQAGLFVSGGGTFLPTDLVVVWGGANDFLLGGQTDPTVPATNITGVISLLAGAGARQFLVPNLPDLGDTPELLATNNAAAIMGASLLSQGFNASLFSQVDTLANNLGLDIWTLDIYSIGQELKTNPGAYGFTNTTQSALLTGNAANAAGYLYWDTVHPTARVHDIFAQRAAGLVPEPGTALFVLLVVAGAGLMRKRVCPSWSQAAA